MKILAFAGSNSRNSINKKLVKWVSTFYANDEVELLDLNDFAMPLYSIDVENESGIPQAAVEFASKIDRADMLVMSLAEHNGSYTVAFKNVFDWVSRINDRKVLGNKPVFLMSTAPGGRGGKGVLIAAEQRFPYSGGQVIATFSLPFFKENFDENKGITNEEFLKDIMEKIKLTKVKMEAVG